MQAPPLLLLRLWLRLVWMLLLLLVWLWLRLLVWVRQQQQRPHAGQCAPEARGHANTRARKQDAQLAL